MSSPPTPDLSLLRTTWTKLYTSTLPPSRELRDPAEPKWPVTLDHCFARIVLDNTVGQGQTRWDEVLPPPAVRNMTAAQLCAAIALGGRIAKGEVDLAQLNQASLKCRRKGGVEYDLRKQRVGERKTDEMGVKVGGTKKRKIEESDENDSYAAEASNALKEAKPGYRQSTLSFKPVSFKTTELPTPPPSVDSSGSTKVTTASKSSYCLHIATLHKITTHPTLTPYRKRLYIVLLSVPKGRYTTYKEIAACLSSSARAVGNGMRNNPFAPEVPCHRVLAADGSIGGFCGDWGAEGSMRGRRWSCCEARGSGLMGGAGWLESRLGGFMSSMVVDEWVKRRDC